MTNVQEKDGLRDVLHLKLLPRLIVATVALPTYCGYIHSLVNGTDLLVSTYVHIYDVGT